ncbi:hypothetical protein Avbf_04830 [Armadillidium vulgare]|nr:hypothetical protein Avbf_04830 [Armadillidium vulgare]
MRISIVNFQSHVSILSLFKMFSNKASHFRKMPLLRKNVLQRNFRRKCLKLIEEFKKEHPEENVSENHYYKEINNPNLTLINIEGNENIRIIIWKCCSAKEVTYLRDLHNLPSRITFCDEEYLVKCLQDIEDLYLLLSSLMKNKEKK